MAEPTANGTGSAVMTTSSVSAAAADESAAEDASKKEPPEDVSEITSQLKVWQVSGSGTGCSGTVPDPVPDTTR